MQNSVFKTVFISIMNLNKCYGLHDIRQILKKFVHIGKNVGNTQTKNTCLEKGLESALGNKTDIKKLILQPVQVG